MKIIKKIKVVLGCTMLLLVPSQVFAHTSGPTGGESSQWSLDINYHAGKSSIGYKVDSSVSSILSPHITSAASRWNGTGVVSFYASNTNYTGTFAQYDDPDSSTNAFFGNYSSSSGHLTSWMVFLNQTNMYARTSEGKTITITHELGHTIGLNDLKNSNNVGVIMYGYATRNATYPTAKDIEGASEGIK